MTKPVTIPNTFATATTAIPLSNLDADFSTVATAMNDANTYSNYAADTGSANAYVVTLTGISAIYSAGLRIQFKAGNANTTASTLNVNAQGAKNITYQDASAIASGTIAANSIVDVMYDGTQFLLMNDPAGGTGGDVVGPASATDNAIVRFDGTTGKLVQNSVVTIADSTGDISGVGQLNATTVDATNLEVTNIKAKDGTAAMSIADSTGVVSVATSIAVDGTTDSSSTTTGSIQTDGGVGIAKKLYVGLDANIYGITVGRGAGAVSTNTAVGASALAANTSGDFQDAFGYQSLQSTTSATQNTALGVQTLNKTTTGSYNVAAGTAALYNNTTANGNIAVGNVALFYNTTGSSNVAIGRQALYSNTTASNNTAVGYQAGYYANRTTDTNGRNVFLGTFAGYGVQDGGSNTYVGYLSGPNTSINASGSFNTAVGIGAGQALTTGSKNTILGGYNGNQGGLDIRTASNYIVLSDGDGNPRQIIDFNGTAMIGTSAYINYGGSLHLKSLLSFVPDNTGSASNRNWAIQTNGSQAGALDFVDSSANNTWPNNAYRVAITSYGINLGASTNTSGMGITFPATQSASSNANTLDDYEEGTFTPELRFGGGNTGITYTNRRGTYTKIGNNVTIQFGLYLSSKGSSTGAVTVTGLPFTSKNQSFGSYGGSILFGTNGFASLTGVPFGLVNENSADFYAYVMNNGAESQMTNTNFGNTTYFQFTITYQVD